MEHWGSKDHLVFEPTPSSAARLPQVVRLAWSSIRWPDLLAIWFLANLFLWATCRLSLSYLAYLVPGNALTTPEAVGLGGGRVQSG
ncbi:hypothetical protein Bpfe_028873 [Biomphalaria pfeifferi]|uniref:Uncharacterized protein n=1 Tax=Biomphalaria pfeifferi TaxID=112525 RepID=A0AAD8ATN9_BIOPF|nr:hypothetical protein Bpfe_028873 [Biomphalaria pfeifferi]